MRWLGILGLLMALVVGMLLLVEANDLTDTLSLTGGLDALFDSAGMLLVITIGAIGIIAVAAVVTLALRR